MNPQRFVVMAVGGATLIVAGGQIASGRMPGVRVFIGGTVAAVILSVAAGPLPGLARGIAALAIIGALLTSGYDLIRPLVSLTGR